MGSINRQISIIAPGCFSEIASDAPPPSAAMQTSAPVAETPAPELNEARVLTTDTQCFEQALVNALRQGPIEVGDLPIAQHQYWFKTNEDAPADCVRADLVHLQTDTSNARLVPKDSLDVSDEDSQGLVDALNKLVNADGIELKQLDDGTLYLTGMAADQLDTWPAHALASGKIANYLPRQNGAGEWRRLLTEVQMLFHSHPVNEARAARQQLPINAIWFWGGRKIERYNNAPAIHLIASDAFSCGLAAKLGITAVPVTGEKYDPEAKLSWLNAESDVLVVDLSVYQAWLSGDVDALKHAKQQLNIQWIAPAQQAVADSAFSEFVLDGCEGLAIAETQRSTVTRSPLDSLKPLWQKLRGITNRNRSSR